VERWLHALLFLLWVCLVHGLPQVPAHAVVTAVIVNGWPDLASRPAGLVCRSHVDPDTRGKVAEAASNVQEISSMVLMQIYRPMCRRPVSSKMDTRITIEEHQKFSIILCGQGYAHNCS